MSNTVEKSATSLNKYDINKSIRAKVKKSVPKPVLCTPYKIEWLVVKISNCDHIRNFQRFFVF